jgi:carbonic anhydrase
MLAAMNSRTSSPLLPASLRRLVFLAGTALLALGAAPGAAAIQPSQAAQAAVLPQEVVARLAEGNTRFVAGQPLPRDWAAERAGTAAAQYPLAVVLSCIDSRVSSEVIFDQGFGVLFSARVAGNVLDDDLLGSMEFACKVAGARLIAVVGHSHCGAIKGACTGAELGHLTGLLAKIQPAVALARQQSPSLPVTDPAFIESVARINVQQTMAQIRERSPVLRELIDAGKVAVVGGVYDLESGKVTFFGN